MANIRIDLSHNLYDGIQVTFKAPCDCTKVDGLKVYYIHNDLVVNRVFTFRDTHGNDLTGVGNLFSAGACVRALLDTTNGHAYLQNADTNGYLESLLSRVSFIHPEIIVTAPTGSNVTCSKDGTDIVLTAPEVEGVWTFAIPEFGTYTIRGEYEDRHTVTHVVVDSVRVYTERLAYSTGSLNDDSWDTIARISEEGVASSTYSLGDEKTIYVDNVPYVVQIIGFNHDEKASGGKAGITFKLKSVLDTQYGMSADSNSGYSDANNISGWRRCELRATLSDVIFSQLEPDLQRNIKVVNKIGIVNDATNSTASGSVNSTEVVQDTLFLLSCVEVFGKVGEFTPAFADHVYLPNDGEQYAYYTANNSQEIIRDGDTSPCEWWLRSSHKWDNSWRFWTVENHADNTSTTYASQKLNISFGFCI